MKYVRRLVFLGLIAGYFLWPYHAAKKFNQAIQDRNAETVSNMIDAEALLNSLKDVMVEAAIIQAQEKMGDKICNTDAMRQQLRSMMNSEAFTSQLGGQLDAANLTQAMFAGNAQAQSMGFTNPGWRNQKWVNPVTFSVQDPHSEACAVFKFRGLGWKLAGLEIPTKELRRFAAVMDRMP